LAIAFHDISLGLEKKRVKRRKKGIKLSGAGGESGKKSTSPPNLSGVDYNYPTYEMVYITFELSKIGQITS
jgi:hypothetical protein